jgi:hypothetical protein
VVREDEIWMCFLEGVEDGILSAAGTAPVFEWQHQQARSRCHWLAAVG